ncbi:hypothetical protein JZ751_021484, partial [Albula glossodonta]
MGIHFSGEKLEQLASEYISETLSCIHTVKEFSDVRFAWLLQRKKEVNNMKNIIDRAEKSKVTTAHITKSQNKLKAMDEYLDSKFTQVNAEGLEKELGSVLKDSLEGLEKMTPFLEAVEKLAVTSLSVFREGNPLCQLPRGTSAADVCVVISAAMKACPLLIHFQRNNGEFFLPSLANADVLALQLEKYVEITKDLCERLQERTKKICIKENLSRKTIQTMYDHLNQLTDIRMDQHFRMAFLFREDADRFIARFSQRSSRMRYFLKMLEEVAVQLDETKKGASIFSMAGSTMGFLGGIATIAGLVMAQVTAGASLSLTVLGRGLNITSGVTSIVAGVTEMVVNSKNCKKANEIFQNYVADRTTLMDCLDEAASSVPDVAPTVMEMAKGLDLLNIYNDSVSLAEGSESDVSKVIRARALFTAELEFHVFDKMGA